VKKFLLTAGRSLKNVPRWWRFSFKCLFIEVLQSYSAPYGAISIYIGMGYLVDQLFFPEQDTGKAM
jgi:hypothetical protein